MSQELENKIWNDKFGEGHGAFNKGKKRQDNPYEKGSIEYDGWLAGWEDRYEDLRTDPLP